VLHTIISSLISRGRMGSVHISAVEVFKDSIRDVLRSTSSTSMSTASGLRLRDLGPVTSVEGASETIVASSRDLDFLLPSLAAAATSCRGHWVACVRIAATGAKLFVVRLADSDSGTDGRSGQRATANATAAAEATDARRWALRSLTSLGNCLKAVGERARIVPVREGVLTRILREALQRDAGGAGGAVHLIAHCALSDDAEVSRLARAHAPPSLSRAGAAARGR
jgi:hypothetical protein